MIGFSEGLALGKLNIGVVTCTPSFGICQFVEVGTILRRNSSNCFYLPEADRLFFITPAAIKKPLGVSIVPNTPKALTGHFCLYGHKLLRQKPLNISNMLETHLFYFSSRCCPMPPSIYLDG